MRSLRIGLVVVFALAACAAQADLSRLSPALRAAAERPDFESRPVVVILEAGAEAPALLASASVRDVAGVHMVRASVPAAELAKLAGAPGVVAVLDAGPKPPPVPVEPDLPHAPAISRDKIRAALKSAAAYKPSAPLRRKPDTPAPESWWGNGFIGVHEAWKLGYDGSGINVAVIDTGVDFAHPDLTDTAARVDNPASPYHGWPICFDGYSMTVYARTGSTDGTWYMAMDQTPDVTVDGETASATATTWARNHWQESTYTFKSESVSGVYRFGFLRDFALQGVLGEMATILLVDHPDTAGRGPGYNTVYVDLDADHDFTDEKPCFRGDEAAYRDVWNSAANAPGEDGYADVSGGMIYFIANGVDPIPGSDWLFGLTPPGDGSLVCFMLNDSTQAGGNHGTLCASAVAARGGVNGNAPAFKPPYSGPGDGMVQGPAPGAGIIAVANTYAGGAVADYYLFCALGYDGVADTGDEADVVSMSYGDFATDNDGWDFESRFLEHVGRSIAPRVSWMCSAGNGGAGYGTVNPPGGSRMLKVGASVQFGAADYFDSIQSVEQIVAGDVASFSDAGPQALGVPGVSVTSNGLGGAGDVPLNDVGSGWNAWQVWSGTSRSCPEAAGVMALLHQAFRQSHGRAPAAEEARRLMMNAAVDQDFDIFRQGAGRVHAGRAVRLAAESGGVSADLDQWTPGGYRGTEHAAFARLLHRGDTLQRTITLTNHGDAAVTVDLDAVELIEFATTEFSFVTVASPSEEQEFRKPDYLRLLHGPGENNIPADTDLMILEAIYPFEDYDTNYVPGDPSTVSPQAENVYRLLVYDWLDVNQNGKLWDDTLGAWPGLVEAGEIDSGEYVRFNYGYREGNSQKAAVAHPRARMHDGIWVGLRHRTGAPGYVTTVECRARFLRSGACPWLSVQPAMLTIPASGQATFTATATVAQDQPYGCYGAKLRVAPRGAPATETMVLPVQINVAANVATGQVFGASARAGTPYDNGRVFGDTTWERYAESGDTRHFFLDVPAATPGDLLVVRTRWDDDLPGDIDTLVFGPREDPFSTPGAEYYDAAFGPYMLEHTGGLISPGQPNYRFNTVSGNTLDYAVAPLREGLFELFVHNVLFGGRRFEVPFRVETGILNVAPMNLRVYTTTGTVTAEVGLTPDFNIPNLHVEAFGPTRAWDYYDQLAEQDPNPWSSSWKIDFNITGGALLEVTLNADADDLDLYLLRDGANGGAENGVLTFYTEVVASSAGPDSSEHVRLEFPEDGFYGLFVHGYKVAPGGQPFNISVERVQGHGFDPLQNVPSQLVAGEQSKVHLSASLSELGRYVGYLAFGPSDATHAVRLAVPMTFYRGGDANNDGLVDALDWALLARMWGREGIVPPGLDLSRDGIINKPDLPLLHEAATRQAR